MKIKLFVASLAFVAFFGVCFNPVNASAYDKNTHVFTFNGYSVDFSSCEAFTEAFNTHPDCKVVALPVEHRGNNVIRFRLIFADANLSKIYFKFSQTNYDPTEWHVDSNANSEFSVSAINSGSFDATFDDGLYTMVLDYNFSSNAISVVSALQDLHSGSVIRIVKTINSDFENKFGKAPASPIEYMNVMVDGNIDVDYADYDDDMQSFVFGSVFRVPLPQTVLTKAVKGTKMEPLKEIKTILPIALVCLVGYVALRKGLAILGRVLRKA